MKNSQKKILLVEDEQSMITLIRYNLETEGYRLIAYKNGKEAIEYCIQDPPDLIISDIGMPGMDGFQLREQLIEHETLQKIPFIYITAKVQSEDKLKAMQLGVSHFLTKPFEPEFLLLTIASILDDERQ
jgi:two-component system alkaline phosphatase synthesis response regulator PhoP